MLKNKAISKLDEHEQRNKRYNLNPIFVLHGSKKDRLIVDCRELNKTIDVEKFTFETIDYVVSLMYSNKMVMTSIDLSETYHSIEIHQEISAPYIYQKIHKVLLNMFREFSNVLLSSYLDDIILVDEEDEYLSGETKRLCEVLINCGFRINEAKSVLVSSKKLQHLGYEII
uniref:Reverse transcriptase domain-containing protein n=1 Tax=Strongyloides venezuelensis TaxID=75913 RepID=A0A0K0FHH2_STRVS